MVKNRISTNRHGRMLLAVVQNSTGCGPHIPFLSVFPVITLTTSPEKNAYCIVMKIAVTSSIDIANRPIQ